MRKIVVTLVIASLLSLTFVAPVSAGGWGGGYHGRGGGCNPLWPIAAALAIPAAVIGTVANLAATVPATYGYAAPQPPETYYAPGAYYAPRVYVVPRYYAPRVYVAPRYYVPRAYVAPTGYYAPSPRVYYP